MFPPFCIDENYKLKNIFHKDELTLTLQADSCLAIIPNACSAKLQPLHQGIKEKFKVSFFF